MKSTKPDHYVVTYCSRNKDPAPGLLPAIKRYGSSRIWAASEASSLLGAGFLILSGKYGLIEPDHEIPDYDHLLTPEQVPGHARVLGQSLRDLAATKIIFISRALKIDPGTGPYREALQLACADSGVGFDILELSSTEPTSAALAELIRPWFEGSAPRL